MSVDAPTVGPRVHKLTCWFCRMDLTPAPVAYQILVERRAHGEPPPKMRCKHCARMNLLELEEGRAAAVMPKESSRDEEVQAR